MTVDRMARRLSDMHPKLARIERLWQNIVPLLALLIAAYAVWQLEQQQNETEQLAKENSARISEIEALGAEVIKEAEERRSESCIVFEREALAAIQDYRDSLRQLRNTILYLRDVASNETPSLNRIIRQSVPRLRAQARKGFRDALAKKAPDYCDEPGFGLDEPNPNLPDQLPRIAREKGGEDLSGGQPPRGP